MTSTLLLALVAFAIVASITPGPNNLMLMTSGINFGFVRMIPHMLGVALGFALMIVVVGAGVATLIDRIPGAATAIKAVSAAYLLYMAWRIATAVPRVETAAATARPFTFLHAAAFQWINPKAWTMALTAVSAYIPPGDPRTGLVVVAGVFGAVNLPSVGVWTVMGVQLRRFLADPRKRRIFNIVAALTLAATLYPVVFASVHPA